MFVILGWVLLAAAVWCGAAGVSWVWCLVLAGLAVPLYVGLKYEQGVGNRVARDLQGEALPFVLAVIFFMQLIPIGLLYAVGLLFR